MENNNEDDPEENEPKEPSKLSTSETVRNNASVADSGETRLLAAIKHKSQDEEKADKEEEKPGKEEEKFFKEEEKPGKEEEKFFKDEEKFFKEEEKPGIYVEPKGGYDAGSSGHRTFANFNCNTFLQKRNPFIHDPPQPEERRARVQNPRTPREYIINLREDLADFQESHGLPRTRDYSFLSLGLALAQETARALCSLFFMFVELFPILAIVSLILRFALDKLIEILETTEPAHKVKKVIIFSLQMLLILIPLWIFIGTIIIPLVAIVFSIFKKLFHVKGGKSCRSAPVKPKEKAEKIM